MCAPVRRRRYQLWMSKPSHPWLYRDRSMAVVPLRDYRVGPPRDRGRLLKLPYCCEPPYPRVAGERSTQSGNDSPDPRKQRTDADQDRCEQAAVGASIRGTGLGRDFRHRRKASLLSAAHLGLCRPCRAPVFCRTGAGLVRQVNVAASAGRPALRAPDSDFAALLFGAALKAELSRVARANEAC